tara:strand:- start:104 stop:727 length:624 start_codon:yes stop_codon:yes gene_type:complete
MKKILHQLNFFNALENAEEKTQKKISSEIAVSIGMANTLIKRFLKKGFIKVQQAPYKRFVYYLTPQGFSDKIKLVKEYINESLGFFRKVKADFNKVLISDNADGYYLYGISEVCEIAILSALENDKKIISIVDEKFKHKKFLNIPVIKRLPKKIYKNKIILTDQINAQADYFKLIKKYDSKLILIIDSLFVSRKMPNFKPKKDYGKR